MRYLAIGAVVLAIGVLCMLESNLTGKTVCASVTTQPRVRPVMRDDRLQITLTNLRGDGGRDVFERVVDNDGGFWMPPRIRIRAVGLTLPELERAIHTAYLERNFGVTVTARLSDGP